MLQSFYDAAAFVV